MILRKQRPRFGMRCLHTLPGLDNMAPKREARLKPSWTCRALLAATLALCLPAHAAPVRDKPLHRIVAVGDLHGDFAAWRAIARAAGLVDAGGDWSGGDTVLVQTGDVVDRGPDSLKIIQDLMRLQPRGGAQERPGHRPGGQSRSDEHDRRLSLCHGGRLRRLCRQQFRRAPRHGMADQPRGLFAGLWHDRDPKMSDDAIRQAWLAATPPGRIEHQIAWLPDGRIGRWIIGNPAAVLVDGTLFVHGGISPAYAHMPLDEINSQVGAALKARDRRSQGDHQPIRSGRSGIAAWPCPVAARMMKRRCMTKPRRPSRRSKTSWCNCCRPSAPNAS